MLNIPVALFTKFSILLNKKSVPVSSGTVPILPLRFTSPVNLGQSPQSQWPVQSTTLMFWAA